MIECSSLAKRHNVDTDDHLTEKVNGKKFLMSKRRAAVEMIKILMDQIPLLFEAMTCRLQLY